MNKMMFMGCTVTILGPTLQVILMPSPIMGPLTLFGPMFFVGLGNGMTLPNASSGYGFYQSQISPGVLQV